jgi:hypothetical protein
MMRVLFVISLLLNSFVGVVAVEPFAFLQEKAATFKEEYPTLSDCSPEEAALLANSYIEAASSANLRKIDPAIVNELLALMQSGEIKIFMRHGEQKKSARALGLNGALQKIEMMRAPDNRDNPITLDSSAEFLGVYATLEYLKEKTGRMIPVQTSRNMRAALPASVFGPLDHAAGIWDCVDYPSEEVMAAVEILRILPDGTLPWEQGIVDRIIKEGAYARITADMRQALNVSGSLLAITHTQQLNALALQLGLPVARMGNFGFIVVAKSGSKLFPNGFFSK